MDLPTITAQQVAEVVPEAEDVRYLARGGQKLVFACSIGGQAYVLKCLLLGAAQPGEPDADSSSGEDLSIDPDEAILTRAKREVATMLQCDCPSLVKLGPIGMRTVTIASQRVLIFSEQQIVGGNLQEALRGEGPLSFEALLDLADDVTRAVQTLWTFSKIHRDIKPANIMRRSSDGRFVLLDAGLVLDLQEESVTQTGAVVGTYPYWSPEQIDATRKRQMDFRSDLFALGVVLYEMGTGLHPFVSRGDTWQVAAATITNSTPGSPRQVRKDMPAEIEAIVMRLLAKRPHLRYRTCDQLLAAIADARRALAAARQAPK